jgi:hypothetical protein
MSNHGDIDGCDVGVRLDLQGKTMVSYEFIHRFMRSSLTYASVCSFLIMDFRRDFLGKRYECKWCMSDCVDLGMISVS